MNPLTRLFRRSRAFRVAFYISMVPVWVLIGYISLDSFGNYSQVGNVTLLLLIMLFAAWAWWYGEDRDRRRAAAKSKRVADDDRPSSSG
jgi:hypothetical protein